MFIVITMLFFSCAKPGYDDKSNFAVEPAGRRAVRVIEYYDNSEISSLNIPPRIANKAVTEIGNNSFCDIWLMEVTIPNTVVRIGAWAFSGNYIRDLSLSRNLTEISEGAFAENRLSSIVIPDKVKKIGYRAFFRNPLRSITIGNNVELEELGGYNEYEGNWKYTAFEGTGFEDFYEENGRRAGIYTYNDDTWSVEFRR